MYRNLLWVMAALALGTVPAAADTFTFNVDYCSNPCLGGVAASNNGGTVTVTQSATNIVDVNVQLNNALFHDQGLDSFAFNITNNPSLTLITGTLATGDIKIINAGGSTWTFNQPAGNTDGAGSFLYSFDCAAGSGHCAGSPSVFEFQVDVTGLTVAALETRNGTASNVDFAANVSTGGGSCTGMVGAGNGTSASTAATTNPGGTACTGTTTATPEPTALLLFGSGLIGIGALVRRRNKPASKN
jgi:hypothetical protein